MGTFARGKLSHLIEDLLARPSAYTAFQALHLLEMSCRGGDGDQELHRFIVPTPARELSYPAGEIRRCFRDRDQRYRLELNFMGLYGVDSPLPQYFNDITARDKDGSDELSAFLNLFSQRLYTLLFMAWKKLNHHGGTKSLYSRYLTAFSGMSAATGRIDYAGVFGTRIRSSQALCGMLADFLDAPVRLRQNVPRWIGIDEPAKLGEKCLLGSNALLGNRLLDVNSHVRILAGPLSFEKALALRPGEPLALAVASLLGDYLEPGLDYDLALNMQPATGQAACLGNPHLILGWGCWLGTAAPQGQRVLLSSSSLAACRQTTTASGSGRLHLAA
ncbi:type VI secretion system baseplate subunit TssG [Desulfuromonas sp. AOP6]|uniref:type VI secretion system baseplate subunit TssG n=1 Tax=Desulfuromonas sp. AOP6 TaxID=1566351 RepID=UPI0012735CA6|nr:type VI secretion system baseplate subunit TssG [Desulfuromonas sp. AOP6]BCA78396.1 type VI secretion protein [Desulfuromonas sp. AOP6]